MKDPEIHQLWTEFINFKKYKYLLNPNETWKQNLQQVKEYIDVNYKRPSSTDKNKEIKSLGYWISDQKKYYNVNIIQCKGTLKDPEIHQLWTEFINDLKYIKYFKKSVKKSVKLDASQEPNKDQKEETEQRSITLPQRQQSEYQEISKKMATQNSRTTQKMIEENEDLWHKYHANRDVSFEGYDDQDEIPLNKITAYLETKSSRRLKILDLGCGRNKIQEKFLSNDKLSVTGYDYVSYNGSQVADIRKLPEEDESVDICVFSQSLMGYNWKEYIKEAKRVLRYNGEMIISESVNRFDTIKEYIDEEELHIKYVENNENNRWFYMYVIND
jgi:ubiquinone/menaquinone biosynthesis C-methylase UbiE